MSEVKNKIRYGLEQVYIAFASAEGWDTPVPIPGAVNLTVNPEGGESPFYADNIKYYVSHTNNGYTGTLEAALIPDAVLQEMLGWEVDTNGMLVEVADGVAKEFALMGQYQGDAANGRFVYYRCTASRPANTHTTKTDAVTPGTQTLNITILPYTNEGKKIVKGVMELNATNKTAYDAFYTAVTLPATDAGV